MGDWGHSYSIVHLVAQNYDSRKSSKERGNKTLKRRLSLSDGTLPSVNPEGGISCPLGSNTARASCTHSPRMLSVRMYKQHVRWQNQQFNSPLGFSHLYCVLCSLILVLPLDIRERQMLAAGFKLRPSHRKAHRSLLVSFPDAECVFKDCVHDSPNTKWGFNYIRDDFFHWNTKEPTSSLKKNSYTKKNHLFPEAAFLLRSSDYM